MEDEDAITARRYGVSRTTVALSEHVHAWEARLRGYPVWGYPVAIEPPFVPVFQMDTDVIPVSYTHLTLPTICSV